MYYSDEEIRKTTEYWIRRSKRLTRYSDIALILCGFLVIIFMILTIQFFSI